MHCETILDITRLFSRRTHNFDTGIDRVERAYFEHFAAKPDSGFLIQYNNVIYFLNSIAAKRALAYVDSNPRYLRYKIKTAFLLRRLSRIIGIKKLELGVTAKRYINVGHSASSDTVYRRIRNISAKTITMIHDVIPLDFPEYCRDDQIKPFQQKFEKWCKYSDQILVPSHYSAKRVEHWAPRNPRIKVVPLAIEVFTHADQAPNKNAFLVVGTIEARKNHMLLLEVWNKLYETLGDACPELWIVGKRGWGCDNVLNFLDSSTLVNKVIFELGAVGDDELSGYYHRSKALLFPSHAEGFGLPLFEAILAGRPVIASNIEPFIEALGASSPSLVSDGTVDSWIEKLLCVPDTECVKVTTEWEEHIRNALFVN